MLDVLDEFNEKLENIKAKMEYEVLENERDKYYVLKDRIKLIIKDLKNSLSDLDLVSQKVVNGYSVNGKSGDNNFLENTRKDIKSTYNYLNNTILPDIEGKISDLSDEMEKIVLN